MFDDTTAKRVLVGAITALVLACSVDTRTLGDAMIEGGALLRDATRSDASAQVDGPCTQWEIAAWNAPAACSTTDLVDGGGCAVPAGWEPIVAQYGDWSGSVGVRRCVAR